MQNNITITPYVAFRRYKGQSTDEKKVQLNLKYGTEVFSTMGHIITFDGHVICRVKSQAGYEHFAVNHDGEGLERGKLTYAIAYAPRKNGTGFRFTDEEQALLRDKWNGFLMDYSDALIFNSGFYQAPLLLLRELANDLSIRKKKGKYVYVHNSK